MTRRFFTARLLLFIMASISILIFSLIIIDFAACQSISTSSPISSNDDQSISTNALAQTPTPAIARSDVSVTSDRPIDTPKPTISTKSPAAISRASNSGPGQAKNGSQGPPPLDPTIRDDLVNGIISSLVPGASGLASGTTGNPMGPLGLLPTISKLSTPLAHLIVSNGNPSVDDVDQLLKAVPDVAVLLGLAGMVGSAGRKSLENMDLTKLPPQLISYVANGGQIPGISPADLQKLTQRYLAQTAGQSARPGLDGSPSSTNISSWTPQQINDLISGAAPLPPLNSLPPDYVQTVLSGGTLPGLTSAQTQAIKQRYTQEMFGGGAIGQGLSVPAGSAPLIANVYANITSTNNFAVSKSSSNQNTFNELKNLDLSKLPPDVLQKFLAGETPDLNKIPQDFLNSLINKSPQLFSSIVSSELQKKINNESHREDPFGNFSGSIDHATMYHDNYGRVIPYDVNSLDRKADISLYNQDDQKKTAMFWTAIVLGVVGFFSVVLITVLCWRHHRNRRIQHRNHPPLIRAPGLVSINPKPFPRSSVTNETEGDAREIRDNKVNAEIHRVLHPSTDEDARIQRLAYTQQWVARSASPDLSTNRQRRDSSSTQM